MAKCMSSITIRGLQSYVGKPIEDFVHTTEDTQFLSATSRLLEDDAGSSSCRLLVRLSASIPSISEKDKQESAESGVEMEATGILIRDRLTGMPSHVCT